MSQMKNYCVEDFNECATICAIEMDKENIKFLVLNISSKLKDLSEHDRDGTNK